MLSVARDTYTAACGVSFS